MVRLRNLQFWTMTVLFYAAICVVCVGMVFGPRTPPAGRVAVGLFVLAVVAFGLHAVRAGIEVDDAGLTVRRWVGRREFAEWSAVERVEFRPFPNGGVYVAPVLHDGRALTTRGLIFKRPSNPAAGHAIDTIQWYLDRAG